MDNTSRYHGNRATFYELLFPFESYGIHNIIHRDHHLFREKISPFWNRDYTSHVTLSRAQWYALPDRCPCRHTDGVYLWVSRALSHEAILTREERMVEEILLEKLVFQNTHPTRFYAKILHHLCLPRTCEARNRMRIHPVESWEVDQYQETSNG